MRYALAALIFAAGCVVRPDGGDLASGDVLPTVAGFTALDAEGGLAVVPWEGDGAFPAIDCPDNEEQHLLLEWVRLDGYTTRGVWSLDRDGIYYGGEQASTGSGTYRIDYHPDSWESEPVTLWRFEILPR